MDIRLHLFEEVSHLRKIQPSLRVAVHVGLGIYLKKHTTVLKVTYTGKQASAFTMCPI